MEEALQRLDKRWKYSKLSWEERQVIRSFMVLWQGYCTNPNRVSNDDASLRMAANEAWDEDPCEESLEAKIEQAPRCRRSARRRLTTVESQASENVNDDDGLVLGGYKFIVDYLHSKCAELGVDIGLECTVKSVAKECFGSGSGVKVIYERGQQKDIVMLRADAVVVTVPLGILCSSVNDRTRPHDSRSAIISFQPNLSKRKIDAINKVGMGTENKIILQFPVDCDGEVFFCRRKGVLKKAKYWQVPDERFRMLSLHAMGKPGCLLVHVSPPYAFETHEPDKVAKELMNILRQRFGDDIPSPINVQVTAWHNDPFSLGAYSYMKVGASVQDKFELAKPEWNGLVHFAGEGISIGGHQCVHGAYDTGVDAGHAVLQTILTNETRPSVADAYRSFGMFTHSQQVLKAHEPCPDSFHIVVIGAGVAGLAAAATAAAAAKQRGKRLNVTVLEGRARLGGRIHTINLQQDASGEDIPVDLGASFIHGCNDGNSIFRLAQQLDVKLDKSNGGYTAAWGNGCKFLGESGVVPQHKVDRLWSCFKAARTDSLKYFEARIDNLLNDSV